MKHLLVEHAPWWFLGLILCCIQTNTIDHSADEGYPVEHWWKNPTEGDTP
ncbi:MAG: hypothetical protein HY975_02940 [Candidatus Kerfeldbacteria bacterium]|nr:hypothetical protein [Candidatus Kerfeldbacteria bacterium]